MWAPMVMPASRSSRTCRRVSMRSSGGTTFARSATSATIDSRSTAWAVLELAQQRQDDRPPRLDALECVRAQPEIRQVERRAVRPAHAFDHRVVPHAAAVEVAGGHEEGRGQSRRAQRRKCHRAVVRVAVIERDAEAARRECVAAQKADRLGQREVRCTRS